MHTVSIALCLWIICLAGWIPLHLTGLFNQENDEKANKASLGCIVSQMNVQKVWEGKQTTLFTWKTNEAVTEAAEVWGAVQMLKEHQTAFQLRLRAGGWAWTNAALCENKPFARCVKGWSYYASFLLIISHLPRKKYALYRFLHAEQQEIFHFKLGLLSCQNIPSCIHLFWRRCAKNVICCSQNLS